MSLFYFTNSSCLWSFICCFCLFGCFLSCWDHFVHVYFWSSCVFFFLFGHFHSYCLWSFYVLVFIWLFFVSCWSFFTDFCLCSFCVSFLSFLCLSGCFFVPLGSFCVYFWSFFQLFVVILCIFNHCLWNCFASLRGHFVSFLWRNIKSLHVECAAHVKCYNKSVILLLFLLMTE